MASGNLKTKCRLSKSKLDDGIILVDQRKDLLLREQGTKTREKYSVTNESVDKIVDFMGKSN